MIFTIKWTSRATKILEKLPKDIALRIWNKTEEIKPNPFRYLEHFEGESGYKFRIGDYRLPSGSYPAACCDNFKNIVIR